MGTLRRDHAGLAEARAERERSEARLAVTRRTVIEPLVTMHRENHFAAMLLETLRRRE